jgi:hypothetical protein
MIKLKNISFFQNNETDSPNDIYATDYIFDKRSESKTMVNSKIK